METVKRLLIAAGQSNLGAGRQSTEVILGEISDFVHAPDGAIYAKVPRGIRAIQPGSDEQVFYTPPNKGVIEDFTVGTDGSQWVLLTYTNAPHQLLRRTLDGVVTTVWTGAAREVQKVDKRTGAVSTSTLPEPDRKVAVTPEGRLWLYGGGQLAAFDTRSQTWQVVKKMIVTSVLIRTVTAHGMLSPSVEMEISS